MSGNLRGQRVWHNRRGARLMYLHDFGCRQRLADNEGVVKRADEILVHHPTGIVIFADKQGKRPQIDIAGRAGRSNLRAIQINPQIPLIIGSGQCVCLVQRKRISCSGSRTIGKDKANANSLHVRVGVEVENQASSRAACPLKRGKQPC